MSLEVVERSLEDPQVWRSLFRILERNSLCAIATVSPQEEAHINTAYFAYTPDLNLYFYSYPETHHALNIGTNRSMAVAVFDSEQSWGLPDRGLQLFGQGNVASGRFAREAERVYDRRFPAHAQWKLPLSQAESGSAPRPYRFRTRSVKLFDERTFGAGVFVHATVPARWTTPPRAPVAAAPFTRRRAHGPV